MAKLDLSRFKTLPVTEKPKLDLSRFKTSNYNQVNQTKLLKENVGMLGGIARDVGNVALGAGKEIAAAPFQLGGAIATAGTGLTHLIGKGVEQIPGLQKEGQRIATAKTDIPQVPQALQPKGTAQQVGKVATDIGEMFLPTGIESTVVKGLAEIPELAKNAPLLTKITQQLLKLGIKSTATGLEFGAKTYLQTGGDLEKSKEAALLSASVPAAGSVLKATGKGLAEAVIPISSKEAQLLQDYKAGTSFWDRVSNILSGKGGIQTAGKTAFEKGLVGTESMIGVGAKRGLEPLWAETISPVLEKAKPQDMTSFWSDVEKSIKSQTKEVSRQKDLLEAFNALKEDYAGVNTATMPTLQDYKSGWASFVPEKYYKGKQIAGAFNEAKAIAADVARQKIYNTLPTGELKKAYLDYGNLIGLSELGQKAMTGGKLKGGFGSFWSAVKDMGLTPIGTIGGQTIYKVGQTVELVGKQGAKTVSDLISPDFKSSQ